MNVLNLEDSKALYDKGIKIETELYYVPMGDLPITKYEADSMRGYVDYCYPAPDLEELLEYVYKTAKDYNCRPHLSHNGLTWIAFISYRDSIVGTGEFPVQALANLLIKLKEKGYEV